MARYGRGRPAHPFISSGIIIVAISDSDTFSTTVEIEVTAAAFTSADTGSGLDASTTIVASFTSADTGSGADTGTVGHAEITDADTASGAEASSIVASMSSADTGNGTETGPSPPATLSSADTGSGAEVTVGVRIPSTDTGSGAEGTPAIAPNDTETASSVEAQDVDAFGGNSKLGQDNSSSTSASTILATISSSDVINSLEDSPYQGVDDFETIGSIDQDRGGPGILGPDTGSFAESQSIVATSSSSDSLSYVELDPVQIGYTAPNMANENVQIRDNGLTPIGVSSAETGSGADTSLAFGIASADITSGADASSLVVRFTQSETASSTETEQSPDVNLPIGIDFIQGVEAGSPPPSHLSSLDSITAVDAEALDRGTPTSRLFVVDPEIRIKAIEAVTRILEVPAEVRVLTVSGGFA